MNINDYPNSLPRPAVITYSGPLYTWLCANVPVNRVGPNEDGEDAPLNEAYEQMFGPLPEPEAVYAFQPTFGVLPSKVLANTVPEVSYPDCVMARVTFTRPLRLLDTSILDCHGHYADEFRNEWQDLLEDEWKIDLTIHSSDDILLLSPTHFEKDVNTFVPFLRETVQKAELCRSIAIDYPKNGKLNHRLLRNQFHALHEDEPFDFDPLIFPVPLRIQYGHNRGELDYNGVKNVIAKPTEVHFDPKEREHLRYIPQHLRGNK